LLGRLDESRGVGGGVSDGLAEGVTAPALCCIPESSDSAEEGQGEAGVPDPWLDGVTCPGGVFCPDGVVCADGVTCPPAVLPLVATVAFVLLITLLGLFVAMSELGLSAKETPLSLRLVEGKLTMLWQE
jgi:hypothetical protein